MSLAELFPSPAWNNCISFLTGPNTGEKQLEGARIYFAEGFHGFSPAEQGQRAQWVTAAQLMAAKEQNKDRKV